MQLQDFKNLIWGISEKEEGKMKLDTEIAFENRKKFFNKIGIDFDKTISAGFVHGNRVEIVDEDSERIIKEVDGLVTNSKNLFLTMATADCLPIYFYDPVKEVIGIAHAGWKGVAFNIVKEVIEKMIEIFNSNPINIVVYVGPHIKKCHFEVQNDVAEKFNEYGEFVLKQDDRIFIDLRGLAKKQLVDIGVKEKNISASDECTHCEEKKYFSFRRDKPEKTEAMVCYIGMK